VGALVRQHDRDRYQTALFASPVPREALFALYAFNYEIARIPESVTQPMLGQIRLQWWREVIDAAYAGATPRAHVVAAPLTAVIREAALTRSLLEQMIDGRERDLASEPPATLAALEDYAQATSANLAQLALEALGVREPVAVAAARDIGIAYGLIGLLRAAPFHARAGRSYLPADLVASDAALRDYAEFRGSAAVCAVAAAIADVAADRLRTARRRRGEIPRAALPALLPAVVAERALVRLRRAGCNPFDPSLAVLDPLQSWRLAAAAWRRRF
jgi:NADH dehydrogenase [ubiquinone] 1 alpha subcomplex assembly factor 6